MSTQITVQDSMRSLFIASVLILSSSHTSAEWQPVVPDNNVMNWLETPANNSNGVPWTHPSIMPITWGDCVPVPIETIPIGIAPMPYPPVATFEAPVPINAPAAFPAPTPFFGAIPTPMPVPTAPVTPICDDNTAQNEQTQKELENLQARYNHAAEASRKKIDELKQALNNTQNQLQNSVTSLEKHSQVQATNQNNINALKNKIAQLNRTSSELMSLKEKENSTLKQQLANASAASGRQAQQLLALNKSSNDLDALKKRLAKLTGENDNLQAKLSSLLKQSSMELGTLKQAHQNQNTQNEALKKQLVEYRVANQTLQAQLSALKTDAADQGKKILALKQSSTQLASLKLDQQEKSKENEALKKQLADIKLANQAFQAQLATQKTDAANQDKQILALKQSSAQLASLKLAQQEKKKENKTLKKQLSDGKLAYQELQAQLAAQKTDVDNTSKQVLALKQSATQLASLKLAQQEKADENESLKKQLAESIATNENLQAQITTLQTNESAQNKKISGLKQVSSQFVLLQQAYKNGQDQISNLKGQLSSLTNTKAELDSCKKNNDELRAELTELKNKAGSQSQKITSLMATAGELDKLKHAYQDLASKKEALNTKLSEATSDTDKDGIIDSIDKCPTTAMGVEVDALGCFADSDKDGIANSLDQCPSSPANSQVNEKGCPGIKDSDKDGVADAIDLCHSSIEGSRVNEFGCAETENITLEGVNFKLGSAKLTPSSFPILDAAAKTIQSNPNLKIEISGHTDNQGIAEKNLRLSQVRANSVMIYLIRKGIDAQSLTAKGYGEEQPKVSNETAEGMATNRRVELKITK